MTPTRSTVRRTGALTALALTLALTVPAAASALTVYAASSLREALPAFSSAPAYNFAGSNQLQLQIERGAPADVFASASPKEAQALFREGRCTRPQTIATNTLVLLVPNSNPGRLRSVYSLRGGGHRIAVGSASVPIGDYTRRLLRRLGLSAILTRNTVSAEPNVGAIVAKVALASADAGFTYRTDARTAPGRVRAIGLPRYAQPPVRYQACVVRRPGANTLGAASYLARLRGSMGRRVLARYGFGLPPRG